MPLIKYKSVVFIAIANVFFSLQALCFESGFGGLFPDFLQYGSWGFLEYAELREKSYFLHNKIFFAENEPFISFPLSPVDGSPSSPWPAMDKMDKMDKEPKGADGGLTSAGTGGNLGGSPSGGGGQGDGGDNPSYPGEQIDFSEEDPSSLFSRLDELMEYIHGQLARKFHKPAGQAVESDVIIVVLQLGPDFHRKPG